MVLFIAKSLGMSFESFELSIESSIAVVILEHTFSAGGVGGPGACGGALFDYTHYKFAIWQSFDNWSYKKEKF